MLLLAVYLPACMSYQTTSQPLTELTTPPSAVESIRVTTTDGQRVVFSSPKVIGDTLRGFRPDRHTDPTVVALPLNKVRSVEIRQKDAAGTGVLALAVVAATMIPLFVTQCGDDSLTC
jgi:hypothetical protein